MRKNCIITVNYFATELLKNISEIAMKYNFDIIIVDNSCDADEAEALKKIAGVTVVINSDNVGFGAGCHIGIETAAKQGAYNSFLFVNPDISEIDLSGIGEALENFENDQHAAYFQPLIRDNRGAQSILGIRETGDFSIISLYTFLKKIFRPLQKHVILARELEGKKCVVYIPSGAFFIVKADVLERIGGFPRETFLYFEEWLFADRVKKLGMYGYIDPSIEVFHQIGYSTGLQYGAGSAKMLRFRHEAFLKVAEMVITSLLSQYLAKALIRADYGVRSLILNIKRVGL